MKEEINEFESVNECVDRCADVICELEMTATAAITALSRLYAWIEVGTKMPQEVSERVRAVFFKSVDKQKETIV